MRRTKAEILDSARTVIGERDDDDALKFLGDLSDSLDEDNEDWHSKYEELDKTWRNKYKERFFTAQSDPPPTPEETVEEDKKVSYTDLFKYQ